MEIAYLKQSQADQSR
jgi:chromosome segregation ATPase